jgi:monoterpene epsilon-lactone hydrolase
MVEDQSPNSITTEGEHALPGSEGWVSPRARPGKVSSFFKSACIPAKVCGNCMVHPCKRLSRGPKRPTWNNRLELMISTLRTAMKSIPRDPQQFRFWADHKIPDAILPVGAVRSKSKIDEIVVDWVWPRHFKSELKIGRSQRKTKHRLTREKVQEWSQLAPVVLYLHGGAYMVCTSGTHREMVYSMVVKGGFLAVVPNYRRVPEVSIPDAVDDCLRAYEYLVKDLGVSPSRICIMGDSAGGALTVLTMCQIRDKQLGLPACGVLISPWADLYDPDLNEMARTKVLPDYDYIPLDAITLISQEVAMNLDIHDPRINPSYANLDGLPPMLIHAGEVEILRPQIERFVEKLPNATYEVIQDMVHVPEMFASVCDSSAEALEHVCKFVNSHIHDNS